MKKQLSLQTASKGLVGALAIAGGTSAYGNIVVATNPGSYTVPVGTNTNTGYDPAAAGHRAWDVNGDGQNDFFFNLRNIGAPAGGTGVDWQNSFNPFTNLQASNGVVGYQGAFVRYASALQAGTVIGGASSWSTATRVVLGSRYFSGGTPNFYGGFAAGPNANGAVAPGTVAFAGFRFLINGNTHYGWAELSTNGGNLTFVRAAYENTPNTAIVAGAIPEPGTMALLAMGAVGVAGVAIKRRRRAAS